MHIYWKDPNSNYEIEKNGNFFTSIVKNKYEIINKIPRFVSKNNYSDNWGLQWNKFKKTQLDSYTKFPISEDRLKRCLGEDIFSKLKGKIVLEAGCGAGRFTEILLAKSASVVSVDMSTAVDANQDNFPQNKEHLIVQADILKLPFMGQQFDLVICLGVLQHTPSPEKTLIALYDQVKPGGWLIVDQYTFSFSYYTQIARIIFRHILKHIEPNKAFKITSLLIDIFLPIHKIGRKFRFWQAIMRRVTPIVSFYHDFPKLSEKLHKEWAYLDTHDNLTDYYKHFTTLKKMNNLFKNLGLENIQCLKAGNGVEAKGQKPLKLL